MVAPRNASSATNRCGDVLLPSGTGAFVDSGWVTEAKNQCGTALKFAQWHVYWKSVCPQRPFEIARVAPRFRLGAGSFYAFGESFAQGKTFRIALPRQVHRHRGSGGITRNHFLRRD